VSIAHDLRIAARRWSAARKSQPPTAAANTERDELRVWFAKFRDTKHSPIRDAQIFEIDATQVPWFDTGIHLARGEWVTTLAAGRVVLSDKLDIWVGPQFQLWMRVGESGKIFNGTRDTHSFRAEAEGRLYLAGCFPGQWGDREGRVSTPLSDYSKFKGGLTVAVLRWKSNAQDGLDSLSDRDERLADEAERLRHPLPPPKNWEYLWFLGRSEIFWDATDGKRPCIACYTEKNVSILQHEAAFDLNPDTRIKWSWKVDELPSEMREDTQASHDYLSIAVEFENGRDITYTWSSELAAGTGYWCPLATWKDREFHVVVRSGKEGLGQWLDESRDLQADYRKYMGEPPKRVVRVWLIAVSIFQRRKGRASFRDIRIDGGGRTLDID